MSLEIGLMISLFVLLVFQSVFIRKYKNYLAALLTQNSHQVNRRLVSAERNQVRQLEGLNAIYHSLKPELPLPSMTNGWTVAPDFAAVLVMYILKYKPKLVVECGSGVSTVLIAYALRKNGLGKVIALEHQQQYAEKAQKEIQERELSSWAEVRHSPLISHEINKDHWLWYDLTPNLFEEETVDFLVVDGPPANIQKLARFPAAPLLNKYLAAGCYIMLDDYKREDEKEIVEIWKTIIKLDAEEIETERGACLLCRQL